MRGDLAFVCGYICTSMLSLNLIRRHVESCGEFFASTHFHFLCYTPTAPPARPNAAPTPAAVWEPGRLLLRLPPTLPSPHSPQACQPHNIGPLSLSTLALVFRPSAALRLRLRLKLSPAPYDVFLEVGQALVVLIPLLVVLPVRPPNAPRAVEVLTTRLDWLRCLGQTRPDLARSCAQASKARSVIKPFAADPQRQSRDGLSSGGQVQP